MFELTILQKKTSYWHGESLEGKLVLFFNEEDADAMFDLINIMIKAARHETEYSIRVIEEGQVVDDEE